MRITSGAPDTRVLFGTLEEGEGFTTDDGGLYIKTSPNQAYVLQSRKSGAGSARFTGWGLNTPVIPVVEIVYKT